MQRLTSVAAMLLLTGITPAFAQGNIWNKLCFNVATANVEATLSPPPAEQRSGDVKNVCLIFADVRDNKTGTLIGRIALRRVASQDAQTLIAMLPPGRALRSGALVRIDDHDPVKVLYATCDKAGCYADATVSSDIVDQLKTGTQVSFSGSDLAGSAFRVPLPLNGFAEALQGGALSLDRYNEFQKRIAEMYRRH
jgi:invasion protein IalB